MIKIRKSQREDVPQIGDICNFHECAIPDNFDFLLVAENDSERIIGMIGLKSIPYIEPLICENPISANKIFKTVENILMSQNIPCVRIICDKNKQKLYEKAGFEIIESEKIIMEKKYNGRECER